MKRYIASVEAPDDWEPKFGDLSVDFFFRTGTGDSDIISTWMVDEPFEPCEDAISRKAVLEIYDEWFATCNIADKKESPKSKIKALPSVNPQKPCKDAISRQAVLDLLVKYDNDMKFDVYSEIFDNINKLPPVNPQKPICPSAGVDCEDAISRAELLKAIDTWDKFGYTETGCFVREPKNDCVKYTHYDDVIECIKGMPPVNPQKPICPSAGVDCEDCPAYEPKILNKWIGAEVLDRIRNEMHATAEKHEDGVYYLRDEWIDEIIDKYAEEGKA